MISFSGVNCKCDTERSSFNAMRYDVLIYTAVRFKIRCTSVSRTHPNKWQKVGRIESSYSPSKKYLCVISLLLPIWWSSHTITGIILAVNSPTSKKNYDKMFLNKSKYCVISFLQPIW